MRVWYLMIGAACVFASQAAAANDARFLRSLQKLGPIERLEQLCDYTALTQIRKDSRDFRPDRAVANAGADVKIKNDTVEATSGAFRSRGKWYALSYTCTTAPDHLKVTSFHYKIGDEIPEAKWASYGLWE
ncbi:MAG: DUF930 domain-containing protein [Pseudolabrys sp.]|nr:DUF930 domain-containing protein [Pseudolabrys sp.]MDP2298219.1 DUF930 domain-containing protein [Pseudolabrys sp.]